MKNINNYKTYLSIYKYMVILKSKREGILEFRKLKTLKDKESYVQELKNKKDHVSCIMVKELKRHRYVQTDMIF